MSTQFHLAVSLSTAPLTKNKKWNLLLNFAKSFPKSTPVSCRDNKSLILPSSVKKFRNRRKMDLLIIWLERIPLLQLYFSHCIAQQGTIFNNIYFKQGTQLCSASFYDGPANWSLTRQIPCTNYFIMIIYYKDFLYFFSKSIFTTTSFFFFFAFWRQKIRRHFVKDVLL